MNRQRKIVVLLVLVAGLILAVAASTSKTLKVGVTRVENIRGYGGNSGETKFVTLQVQNNSAGELHFAEHQWVSVRIGGQWTKPVPVAQLQFGYLAPQASRQDVVVATPPEAEACKLMTQYRIGRSPYCQAYFFLQNHGAMRKFPGLSRWVLTRFFGNDGWKRVSFELKLQGDREPASNA
jgi:hypothetical protein